MSRNRKDTKVKSKATAKMSLDEHIRFLTDAKKQSNIIGPQLADWLAHSVRVTKAVASGNTELIPVFWIRVYGILADIRDKLVRHLELAPSAGESTAIMQPVQSAISALADVFSEDELIYLQYRRHVECHPLQEHYSLKLTETGLKDSIFQRIPKNKMTITATMQAVDRILVRYKFSEDSIAHDFAARSVEQLQHIQTTSIPWCGPQRR